MQAIMSVVDNSFIDPFIESKLVCISSGVCANSDVSRDLLQAKEIGKKSADAFVSERLSEDQKRDFYDPISRMKLKTFANMKRSVKVATKNKLVVVKADRNLFSRIALISQSRNLRLADVFSFPLGPFPWSLAGSAGELKKTNKSALLHGLEKGVLPCDSYPDNSCTILDGMALVQRAKVAGCTFQKLASQLFESILAAGCKSGRIDVVFDVYRRVSIKNAERLKRATDSVVFKQIMANQPIKQWNSFLSSSENKTELIKFLVSEWKKENYRKSLGCKKLLVTSEDNCFEIQADTVFEVEELYSTQEEADTRLLLHAKHANNSYSRRSVIHTPDTDVICLCITHSSYIEGELFVKTGVRNQSRIISIQKIRRKLLQENVTQASENEIYDSLLGLHAFSGCDSVSSFSGKGKMKAFKLMYSKAEHIRTFKELGTTLPVTEELHSRLERFTCALYNQNDGSVNSARYKIYCSKDGKADGELLPPCQNSLRQHCLRANYQAHVWRQALIPCTNIGPPEHNGWEMTDGLLAVRWMTCKPAPEEVLELLSCDCRRKCVRGSCECIDNGLKCTEACRFSNCDNFEEESDEILEDGDSDEE